jgi:hypothetical protein
MLTNASKILLSIPLIVFICSIFAVVNGMTIPSELLLICTAGFAAILCLLLNVIFTLLERIFKVLREMQIDDQDEDGEKLREFIQIVEEGIVDRLNSNKDK